MGFDDTNSEAEDEGILAGGSDFADGTLVNRAANAAMEAAAAVLGEHFAGDEAVIFVAIDAPEVEKLDGEIQGCTSGALKATGEEPTIGDVLALLLTHAIGAAKAAGKELQVIPVEQGDPRLQ